MKHFLKLIYLSCFSILLWSCSDEIDKIIATTDGGAIINTPLNDDVFVLNPLETLTNPAITITWNDADYQTQTAINYTIEFASTGTNFAEPIIAGITTNTFLILTISELNSTVSEAGLLPFVESELDIRIKSNIGSENSLSQYSETVRVLITPFTTDLPTIAVPGNHQDWDPSTAPLLASSAFGETDYEGYVWLDGEHKFIGPDTSGAFDWGNTDWGDDGSFTGLLLEEGESNCNAPVAGHYFVQADTDALTYSETLYNWGLIGSATPDNWDSDQDMTYDDVSKTWTITLDLSAEEIKFRANDAWNWDYGDSGADGSLENGGDNIVISAGGNYTVILDLSTPREYTYSLILN